MVKRASPEPKRSPASAATAISRNAVRLSGAGKLTWAMPSAPVTSAGAQNAVATNRERTRPASSPPPSPPSSLSSSSAFDGSLARSRRFQVVALSTPRPYGA